MKALRSLFAREISFLNVNAPRIKDLRDIVPVMRTLAFVLQDATKIVYDFATKDTLTQKGLHIEHPRKGDTIGRLFAIFNIGIVYKPQQRKVQNLRDIVFSFHLVGRGFGTYGR